MPTIQLSQAQFLQDVFDYTTEKEWKYKGDKPAIIDFMLIGVGPVKWLLLF